MKKTIRQLYEDYNADMVTAADKARLEALTTAWSKRLPALIPPDECRDIEDKIFLTVGEAEAQGFESGFKLAVALWKEVQRNG